MKLADLNPYVRFARIHKKELRRDYIVAPDHRIFYCADGHGVILVDDKEYSMQRGAFLLIRAGTPYKGRANAEMELYAVNFDMKTGSTRGDDPLPYHLLADFSPDMLAEPCEHWFDAPIGNVFYVPEFYRKENFALIVSEFMSGKPLSRERCAVLLKDIMILALRESSFDVSERQSDAILAYVREHFCEPLTNESVAAHFSYHKNYINAILKREIGQTLHAYLLQYRISVAVSLLSSGEYGVAEAGARVGFGEAAHFSRAFKKITGRSPISYLSKGKNDHGIS